MGQEQEVCLIVIVEPEEIVQALVEELNDDGGVAHIMDWDVSVPFTYRERHQLAVTREGIVFTSNLVSLRPRLVTGDLLGCDFSGSGDLIFRWCCWEDMVAALTQKKLLDRMRAV